MLNIRLYELLNQAEPPYLYAFVSRNRIVRSKSIYTLTVGIPEDGIERGLNTALTEVARVRIHGFTETELERTKTRMIRRMEKAYQERKKTESRLYAAEYQRNFLEEEPVPGIEFEFKAVKEMVPGISLKEVNSRANKWLPDRNRVVLVNAPAKEGLELPDEYDLASIIKSVDSREIPPYIDLASEEPLVEGLEQGADFVSETYSEELDLTTLVLSNGIRILLKPTNFKNDEVLFQGFSPGGNSLVPDHQYRSSRAAPEIISISGVGAFDLNTLNKKLTGKDVSVFPYIDDLSEGLIGSASPRDLETLLQLVYLYITSPRKDSSAYLSYKARMQGFIENRFSDPEAAFYDTLQVTLSDYHYRRRPWSMEMLEEIDFTDIHEIYADRFSDAGDFTFVFTGNFYLDTIRPVLALYLGNLPAADRSEYWGDIKVGRPAGIIEKTVEKGIEPRSMVSLNFTGDFNWSHENEYALNSMASVLRIRLREVLREDLSGTYGTRVNASSTLFPKEEYKISISFGCSPERTDELTAIVFEVIDSLKNDKLDPLYITKVSETQRRSFETSLKQNRFWLANLVRYSFREQDPALILNQPQLINTLNTDMIRDAARAYFDEHNYVRVILMPGPTSIPTQ
jgi:zinc protease